eukprot:CAMPEP_0198126758 /NCGR_PEP_ID=MMETSP1442-20131203/45655_1 /TAXON_ID= /ORGANISM="Craspedostauros australis, Strain CCMP3328" /LENGTH=261 /DNA_ID=CAMNT_0043786625 /DNA_START=31 /DNA_END=816 /DNA_ORIENTATION=-
MRVSNTISLIAMMSMASTASAWVVPSQNQLHRQQPAARSTTRLQMAIDYNDPLVAEEFNKVQPLTFEEVEEELQETGIRAPPTMNEMEVKLMLVEVRMRAQGKLDGGGETKKKRPASFDSKFEEAMWTKPAFEELYEKLKAKDDHNSMNVVTEYMNDPVTARKRYSKTYRGLLRSIDSALTAVNGPTIQFTGFPANMGEAGLKMTLEAVGAIADIDCEVDDTFPVLKGTVTFEDTESAKKAVEQYNGMDMGMGTNLELISV